MHIHPWWARRTPLAPKTFTLKLANPVVAANHTKHVPGGKAVFRGHITIIWYMYKGDFIVPSKRYIGVQTVLRIVNSC